MNFDHLTIIIGNNHIFWSNKYFYHDFVYFCVWCQKSKHLRVRDEWTLQTRTLKCFYFSSNNLQCKVFLIVIKTLEGHFVLKLRIKLPRSPATYKIWKVLAFKEMFWIYLCSKHLVTFYWITLLTKLKLDFWQERNYS